MKGSKVIVAINKDADAPDLPDRRLRPRGGPLRRGARARQGAQGAGAEPRQAVALPAGPSVVERRKDRELPRPRPQVPPAVLRGPGRPGPRRPHARQRHRHGPRRARVPLHRRPRRRQDDERAPPRQVPQLRGPDGKAHRADGHAVQRVRAVQGDHRGAGPRRPGDRRRQLQRRRRGAPPAGGHERSGPRATASRSTSSTRCTCSRRRRGTRS